jgi:signal transduction histidine kinase
VIGSPGDPALLARQLAVLAELGQQALLGVDPDTLMQKAVALVAETLDVEYCKVLELLPDGDELRLRAGVGWREGAVGRATVGAGTDSQAGYTLIAKEPVIVEAAERETRFELPPLLREHHVVSGISAVIPGWGRAWGVLGAHTARRRPFAESDGRFVQGVAHVLGAAVMAARRSDDELSQAEKLEAVGRLAGGIAHDFNNLLTVIGGRSDLLLQRLAPDSPGRRDAELIQAASRRAARLTHQLLAFGRRQVLMPKAFDLGVFVAGLEPTLRRLLGQGIELVVATAAPAPVMADPGQLEQVVVSLVTNARDAMPGGGRLTLQTAGVEADEALARRHAGLQPGSYAVLTVRDTGSGMDGRTQARIFEPFFTTKDQGRGTGLGLAMVYGIVRQSGGGIGVDSAPGRGTTFSIYLPLAEAGAGRAPDVPGAGTVVSGAATILLVEDDDDVRALTRETLGGDGYRVLEAPDAEAALRVAARGGEAIHLLLTDVVLPGLNGPQLAERFAALRPDARVLFVSGYTDQTLEPGAAFLMKPFEPEVLLRKVREVLGR